MKIGKLIILTLFISVLAGCTQNNGDIHGLFGQWKLEKITADGALDPGYDGDMVWAFQNDIVRMQIIGENHFVASRTGTFEREGDIITFNFTHSDDLNAPGTGQYAPPPATHFPSAIFHVRILKLGGGKLELQYVSDQGITYIYYLKKWG